MLKMPIRGWMLAALVGWVVGCGAPEIVSPDTLQVIYMPLDGAVIPAQINEMTVSIYFSDNIDGATVVLNESVYLESGTYGPPEGQPPQRECLNDYQNNNSLVSKEVDEKVVNVILPALDEDKCYRLICTTKLAGTNQGHLRSIGFPDKPTIGAISTFRTSAN
jgi:hypothetical protein